MNIKSSILMKKIMLLVVNSLIFSVLAYLALLLISNQFNYYIRDVVFFGGLILVILGGFMSMHGNPSVSSVWGLGQKNAQYTSFLNLEAKREEIKLENSKNNLSKNLKKESKHINIVFIISGLLLIIYNQFLI